jgi:hypothetical protein
VRPRVFEKAIIRDRCATLGNEPSGTAILLAALVFVLATKLLWGYWERDLTFGDTSALFADAVRWHLDGQINIVWSPLYTAYFGSSLGITENAVAATLLHRVGLILISTGLVAWLGFLTLPRILALLLVVWWIALPIHYDTLYEVHLFGALPILVMALVSFLAGERWRGPLLLSIALIGTFLIRNEYVLVVGVLAALAGFNLLRKGRPVSWSEMRLAGLRYGAVLFAAGLLIAYFYSVSYIKGSAIREVLGPKHTLNMCQVYAFGYQQRHSDWAGSPWLECSSLMQAKFGAPLPTLREMIVANPGEVAEHFLWNLSLTRAGLEVLLFNTTSAHDNPDYAPVLVVPVLPSLLLGATLMICVGGAVVIFRKSPVRYADIRERLARMEPLLLAAVVMAIAVILTQRPRPSYLLGVGVLYMWVVMIMLSAFMGRFKKLDSLWAVTIFAAALVLLVPTYRSLSLPSKMGSLGLIYSELRPQAPRLCQASGALAIGEYASEINNYLCSPYRFGQRGGRSNLIALSSLPADALSAPVELVNALEAAGVGALVIDPFLFQKNQGLKGCPELRDVLVSRGWEQLGYAVLHGGRCIAAFVK